MGWLSRGANSLFELMETYADRPLGLADASLIVAAEEFKTCRVFTVDGDDFQTYRMLAGTAGTKTGKGLAGPRYHLQRIAPSCTGLPRRPPPFCKTAVTASAALDAASG